MKQLITLMELLLLNGLLAYSAYIVLAGGTFSLGFVAFIGLGMYTAALLYTDLDIGLWPSMGIAVGVSLILAYLISKPLARLKGIYLAIATIALVVLFQSILTNWRSVTRGAAGIYAIPLETGLVHFLVACLLIIVVLIRLERTAFGRAVRMVRLDPMIAASMGVNVAKLRLQLLLASSAVGAAAGVLRTYYFGFVTPADAGFQLLIALLAIVILGGVEHWSGPLIGSAVFTLLPEILKPFGDWREIANGVVLLIVVIALPDGITGGIRRLWFRYRHRLGRGPRQPKADGGHGVEVARANMAEA